MGATLRNRSRRGFLTVRNSGCAAPANPSEDFSGWASGPPEHIRRVACAGERIADSQINFKFEKHSLRAVSHSQSPIIVGVARQ